MSESKELKGTDHFKNVIQNHLEVVAASDPLFAKSFSKPEKNIDDCIRYILTAVKKSGCHGFPDEEIYGIAMHYYDEDDLEIGDISNCKVIINHTVQLTDTEKEQAKQSAIDAIIREQKSKLQRKPTRSQTKEQSENSQSTLF